MTLWDDDGPFTREKILNSDNTCISLNGREAQIRLTDEHVGQLLSKAVISIELSFCVHITDTSLIAIAKSCQQIRALHIRGTKVTDEGIRAIARSCCQLQHLRISETKITDEGVIAIVQGHPQLRTLDIEKTKVTDNGIHAIAQHCPLLHTLNMGWTDVTDQSIIDISRSCPNLQSLDLDGTIVTDKGITAICQGHPLLHKLHIKYTHITDEGVKTIVQGCPQLQSIDIEGNRTITNQGIITIAKGCPLLQSLNLNNAENITDEGIMKIGLGCRLLQQLKIQGTSITDKSMFAIAQCCPQIRELNIKSTNITDEAIKKIAIGCRQLRTLHIGDSADITDEGIILIAQSCSLLQSLYIDGANVTDEVIIATAQACPQLHSLLIKCNKDTDEDRVHVVNQDRVPLRSLNIDGAKWTTSFTGMKDTEVTNKSIQVIARSCPQLQSLHIEGIEITDHGIIDLAQGCPLIRSLYFGETQVTDMGLKSINQSFPKLHTLHISSPNITDRGIQLIAMSYPQLKSLGIKGTQATDDSISAIIHNCRYLETLSVQECNITSLPDEIGDLLSNLKSFSFKKTKIWRIPRSLTKLIDTCTSFEISDNPLQEPPECIAIRGLKAIQYYFNELDKGSEIITNIKVVLIGQEQAGKTSIRRLIQGKFQPMTKESERTIYMEVKRVEIQRKGEAPLKLKFFDCGGNERYTTAQVPFLTKMAFYLLVVPAKHVEEENKYFKSVHRFLVLLQTRAPGSVIQLVLSKTDEVSNSNEIKNLLLQKVTETIQKWRSTLNVQPEVIAVSVKKNSSKTRNNFIEMFSHLIAQSPPILPSLGQVVPTSLFKLRNVIEIVREIGDITDDGELSFGLDEDYYFQTSNDSSAMNNWHNFCLCKLFFKEKRSTDIISTHDLDSNGSASSAEKLNSKRCTYVKKSKFKDIWTQHSQYENSMFTSDDIIYLLETQGEICTYGELVYLEPELMIKITRPLINHTLDMDSFNAEVFEKSIIDGEMKESLQKFVSSGILSNRKLLQFLWHDMKLDVDDYYTAILMLVESKIIFSSSYYNHDIKTESTEKNSNVILERPIVLYRLNNEKSCMDKYWPPRDNQKEYEMRINFVKGCPDLLAAHLAATMHSLGNCLYAWLKGAIVVTKTNKWVRVQHVNAQIHNSYISIIVRSKLRLGEEEKNLFNYILAFMNSEKQQCFPGLEYNIAWTCPSCIGRGRKDRGIFVWSPHRENLVKKNEICNFCKDHVEMDFIQMTPDINCIPFERKDPKQTAETIIGIENDTNNVLIVG